MDHSLEAEGVVGAGRGALIVTLFGAGWLGWGLGEANAFTPFVGLTFALLQLILLGCSVAVIVKGRRLRKRWPPVAASTRKAVLKSYLLVVLLEALAIAFVWILAWRFHRPDLGADWTAMIVGLHFVPLAKLFRAPHLGVIGLLITLWGALSWAIFRSNALVIAAALGTGTLLWAASVSALFSAHKIMHWLQSLSAR